eukprot:5730406-Pyramimonas_sp.AAC.1
MCIRDSLWYPSPFEYPRFLQDPRKRSPGPSNNPSLAVPPHPHRGSSASSDRSGAGQGSQSACGSEP